MSNLTKSQIQLMKNQILLRHNESHTIHRNGKQTNLQKEKPIWKKNLIFNLVYNLKDMNQIQSSGIGLLVGLITTFFALGKWGIRPPNKKSNISPKNTAFGIWTPIFILVIFKSLNSIINENANEKPLSLILLSLSFICSALWVFFASRGDRYEFAGIAITSAAFLAFFSHYFENIKSLP